MATPLYVRSVYSLLSSMCSIENIVLKCSEYGYKAIGLVDKNVLYGAMSFKKECLKQGIKPIFGMEVDLKTNERLIPIILYAKNDCGYKNLMKLSSYINTSDDSFIDVNVLNKYRKDNFLVLLSDNCPLTFAYERNEDLDSCVKQMKKDFGDFLLGLNNHDIKANLIRDKQIKPILKINDIKTIALSLTLYPNKDDAYEYEVLKCIRDKKTMEKNPTLEFGRYFLQKEEYFSLYDDADLKNSDVLANNCNCDLAFKTSLPSYKTSDGVTSKQYLTSLANAGLNLRLKNRVGKVYRERLDYELSIILKMHFEDYFLIVYDFIKYAKKNNILVGPGRGSAAGSLVSYCLGITDIDPIKYGLLFERFLNPERVTMPDIDSDFPDDKRDEMFEYVRDRYGKDHVGHIVTYGTLKAKQVLRDVGRVLNYNSYEVDSLCKSIPLDPKITLDIAYSSFPLFKQRIDSSGANRKLFDIAKKLEGNPRHISTHAAGVVFSSLDLQDVVPVVRVENDFNSTQYTMEHLEELGLIKMDFLGLRNLGIISEVVEDIKTSEDPNFNIKAIPLDDKKTFDLIDNVNLSGVFQLESSGMQSLARKMKPRSFLELSMMIALFRPGPMENIPEFLNNRANPKSVKYLHEDLRPILQETYGIIVYQEQIMTIARVMANFSYGKADVLRRAMSKKKKDELIKLQRDFIDGCLAKGYDLKLAQELYDLILKFANYGFNKSHSIAYGLVAYQMAYLKANYPLYFYKALLNGTIGSSVKTYDYIKECKKIGLPILGVSINNSDSVYKIINKSIIMPFGVVKDVGGVSINKILQERRNGPFKDYVDTVFRLIVSGVDKTVVANLIACGGFDELKHSRYTMSEALDNTLRYVNTHRKELDFITTIDDSPIIVEKSDNKMVMAEKEKEVLGFYFSYNPIYEYKKEKNINVLSIQELSNIRGFAKGFGRIRRIKEVKTKKGDLMCFADVIDDSASISLAIMPESYKKYHDILKIDQYIVFEGKIEKEDSVLVKTIICV